MHLQGFDSFGASAGLWGASDTGFNVSGVFRDQGDFAVVVLFQNAHSDDVDQSFRSDADQNGAKRRRALSV